LAFLPGSDLENSLFRLAGHYFIILGGEGEVDQHRRFDAKAGIGEGFMSIAAISAALAAIRGLKRTCPRCGTEQIVLREEKHVAVPCRSCGVIIPPAKPQKS
jgi:hypothetical protein